MAVFLYRLFAVNQTQTHTYPGILQVFKGYSYQLFPTAFCLKLAESGPGCEWWTHLKTNSLYTGKAIWIKWGFDQNNIHFQGPKLVFVNTDL